MSAEIVRSEPDPDEMPPVGYLELIRSNPNFRMLWLGQIVSELGDWLSTVALLNLMLELTGRAQVVGWYFIIIHIPGVLAGPFSGVLVDRLDRKKIMIAMDLVRALLVLGYLLVQRADQIWLLYLVAALGVTMMTLFEPARTASVPNLCRSGELVSANALSSITWSVMLTLGAAIGGFVAAAFGRNACYVVDSASFVLSALLISRVRLPRRGASSWSTITLMSGFSDIARGFRYLKHNARVFFLVLVKTGWGLGGGVLLVLSVLGEKIFPVMGSGAAGIGVLYAARGIGTGLGPVFARRISGQSRSSMRFAIGAGFFLSCLFYILFGYSPILPIAAMALVVAHMGGSITWVFSTVLLQLEIPDEFRGRVFAIEFALLTLAVGISNYAAGYLLDVLTVSPRNVAVMLGIYFAVPGALWLAAQRIYR